jgi:4-hydroxy-tetrahydrodipicolinate reductase
MRAIHYGVGPVGAEVVRLVLERAYIDSVAAIDPARAGRDLGEVVGIDRRLGSTVAYEPESVLTGVDADVVLHTGQASLATAYPQIAQAVTAGKSVISDCAELVFPWFRHPEISRRLDRLAREAGVAVLGVGVGSGFVMDSLPLLLATACSQIKAVSVKRVSDIASQALELRDTVGIGLSPEGFRQIVGSRNAGLPGLRESLLMIAHTLSWRLDDISETMEPILARERLRTEYYLVEKGYVRGLRHAISGVAGERPVIRLEMEISIGAENPHDEIVIEGEPPIRLSIAGGLQGDVSTAAIMVNCIPAVLRDGVAGLLSMRDLPVAPYRDKGVPTRTDSSE